MHFRRILAVAALSVAGLTGLAAPALADTVACDSAQQGLAEAQQQRDQARSTYVGFRNAGHDKLVKIVRGEARAEARKADRELRGIIKSIRKSDAADRHELVKELKSERKKLARANRVLHSQKALRAEIKAERRALKQAWEDANDVLREAEEAVEDNCTDEPTEAQDDTDTGDDTGTEADTDTGDDTDAGDDTVSALGKEN